MEEKKRKQFNDHTLENEYAEFYRKILTENYRMNFLWTLQETEPEIEAKVRSIVGATFPKNPRID